MPATPDTLYRLASVTKAFTAVLLHRLAAQGVVGLDDTLVAHWPGFTMYDPWEGTNGTTITLRHLASHMAGFGRVTPPSINSTEDALRVFATLGGMTQPAGLTPQYSNPGCVVRVGWCVCCGWRGRTAVAWLRAKPRSRPPSPCRDLAASRPLGSCWPWRPTPPTTASSATLCRAWDWRVAWGLCTARRYERLVGPAHGRGEGGVRSHACPACALPCLALQVLARLAAGYEVVFGAPVGPVPLDNPPFEVPAGGMFGNAANLSAALQFLAAVATGAAVPGVGLSPAQARDLFKPVWLSADTTFQQGTPWEMFVTSAASSR